MDKKKRLTYIAASTWPAFLEYQKDHPNLECEYIVSVSFLAGRHPAPIVVLDNMENRWDGIGILDMIEIFKERHSAFFAEKSLDDELKEVGLTDEDLNLGV